MAFIQGSYARSNEMFQNAHHLQVSQCTFTNVGGNVYYDSRVSIVILFTSWLLISISYIENSGVFIEKSLVLIRWNKSWQVIPYIKGSLSGAGPDYYIVGFVKQGSPWESVHIVRRFTSEEDRDQFSSLLHKLGLVPVYSSQVKGFAIVKLYRWAPFTMKPLWSLMIYGDPCLAVASAGMVLSLFETTW